MDNKEDNSRLESNAANNLTVEDKSIPACCVGCVRWEKFGKNCYYYWEGKKHCTMWISSWDDAMQQQL